MRRNGAGSYSVNLGWVVSGRFFDATLDGRTAPVSIRVYPSPGNPTEVIVRTFDPSGNSQEADFWLSVY